MVRSTIVIRNNTFYCVRGKYLTTQECRLLSIVNNNTVTMSIEEYDMQNKKTSTNIPLEERKQNLEQLSSVENPMTINSTKSMENNNRKNHNSVLEVVLDKNNIHIYINNNRHR